MSIYDAAWAATTSDTGFATRRVAKNLLMRGWAKEPTRRLVLDSVENSLLPSPLGDGALETFSIVDDTLERVL